MRCRETSLCSTCASLHQVLLALKGPWLLMTSKTTPQVGQIPDDVV